MKTHEAFGAGLHKAVLTILLLASVTGGQGQPAVVLNELVADNQSGLENTGDFPDWVELRNTTGVDVDLGDWSLTDVPLLSRKFVFPLGTVLPANGYLLVYCDARTDTPGLHTGFSLSDNGETLALFASVALGVTLQDQVTFGLQTRDRGIGRVPDGTGEFMLTTPTPLEPNIAEPLGDAATLKINEWSALNGDSVEDPDADWFELYNPDPRPVALGGLILTDQLTLPPTNQPITALSFIEGGGFVQFIADDDVFPADNVAFKLSSTSGDNILLYQPDGATLIDAVEFGPQSLNISQGRLPDGSDTIVFFRTNQSTEAASNFLPLTDIVISEVLTHSVAPLEDAIELQNVSSVPVDISHWLLSDSQDQPDKFRIPAGTILPPGGFIVFYEGVGTTGGGFNSSGTGLAPDFTLDATQGGELYLFTSDAAGNLTGMRRGIDFGGADAGVSFGRHILSTGEGDISAMTQRTFGVDQPGSVEQFRTGTGLPNATPKPGEIVITEIFYHPPDLLIAGVAVDNSLDEFIELQNVTATSVPLYDIQQPLNTWRVRGGIDFDFPPDRSLGAGESLLIVNFDPADPALLQAFRDKYGVPLSIPVFGPYEGKLANDGATIELQRPGIPQSGLVPRIVVDRVKYSDSAPWPATPDGQGDSLQRCQPTGYGSEPLNWAGGPPTAGKPGVGIRLRPPQRNGSVLTICFGACAGQSYTLQTSLGLDAPSWTKVTDVTASQAGDQCVETTLSTAEQIRVFRVVTPVQP